MFFNTKRIKSMINKLELSEQLVNISTIDDVFEIFKLHFNQYNQYIFNNISNLIKEWYSDSENKNNNLVKSLKGVLFFLLLIDKFKKPIFSISGDGIFYIDWYIDGLEYSSLTLRFVDSNIVEYRYYEQKQKVISNSYHLKEMNIENIDPNLIKFWYID